MKPSPIITNEPLLVSFLRLHPEFQRAAVCSCGCVMSMRSMPGHIGGSNRKWTVKAKFSDRHHVIGHTIMEVMPG